MEDLNPVLLSPAAASGSAHDDRDDACSICLEPFSCQDPSTVTNCKHEYHLQCILEWSQRSKECPICWQSLALDDPTSQELLAAVEIERSRRTRRRSSDAPISHVTSVGNFEFHNVSPYAEDLDERIMHSASASMDRAQHSSRRERHYVHAHWDNSQFHLFAAPQDEADLHQSHMTLPIETHNPGGSTLSRHDSSEPTTSSSPVLQSGIVDNCTEQSNPRNYACQTSPDSPRQSDIRSFSESLKSRFSAASTRYKESISKSTLGLKEKLLARNNSVKKLSKEVQREVTAGVARMMERLDPTSKRTGGVSSVSIGVVETSELSHNGSSLQETLITHPPDETGPTTAQVTCPMPCP